MFFFLYVEIGVLLTACGVGFMFLGILLFFDGGLLAMGNVCYNKKKKLYLSYVLKWIFFFPLKFHSLKYFFYKMY
jgi:hypothetical protein